MAERAEQQVRELDTLWTPAEVATYLRVSRSWVYQKAEAGLLPSLRFGGCLRFEPDAIRAYARGKVPPSNVIPLRRT
jgi:excisionase family DNA binding protein